jgi:uncharacterized protein (UPF0303 family)
MAMKDLNPLSSVNLIEEENLLILPSLEVIDAINIAKIATSIGLTEKLPIAIQIRFGNWIIYHVSLPGSSEENLSWLNRKGKVVSLKHHSSLYEGSVLLKEMLIGLKKIICQNKNMQFTVVAFP